ncbi:MAG: GNAT family N-acetyltransferase [Bdellovibrionales bacterium]
MSMNTSYELTIRPVQPSEKTLKRLASMERACFTRENLDPFGPQEGALGKQYPRLKKYFGYDAFITGWRNLTDTTKSYLPPSYGYVAYARNTQTGREKPVGFIKSPQWEAGAEMALDLTCFAYVRRLSDVAEIGTICVDTDFRDAGIGTYLVARVAKEALNRGFKQMTVRLLKDSRANKFFTEKTGARQLGPCEIPCRYDLDLLDAKKLRRSQLPESLSGTWMFWDSLALSEIAKIATPAIFKPSQSGRRTNIIRVENTL